MTAVWKHIENIPERNYGSPCQSETNDRLRERHPLRQYVKQRNEARRILDPDALTIGFAGGSPLMRAADLQGHDRIRKHLDKENAPSDRICGQAHPADKPARI